MSHAPHRRLITPSMFALVVVSVIMDARTAGKAMTTSEKEMRKSVERLEGELGVCLYWCRESVTRKFESEILNTIRTILLGRTLCAQLHSISSASLYSGDAVLYSKVPVVFSVG